MVCAYIGLGSNLGDPESHISRALTDLQELPQTQQRAHSSLYKTRPVGPQDQGDFINAVSCIETDLTAPELLQRLQDIENKHGRVRTDEQWGPRKLDLDLLLYGDEVIELPDLVVPHPQMHQRCFVLLPLVEIAPEVTIPLQGDAAELLERADCQGVRKIQDA